MPEVTTNPYHTIDILSQALVIIGAINWGLIGVADLNVVKLLFKDTVFSRIVYGLVGLAGVLQLVQMTRLYAYSDLITV